MMQYGPAVILIRAHCRYHLALVLVALCAARALFGLEPSHAAGVSGDPLLLAPTRGRPVFAPAGGRFMITAHAPEATGHFTARLLAAGPPARTIPLEIARPGDVAEHLRQGRALTVRIPPDTPDGTYDLEVVCGTTRVRSWHCVRVGEIGDRIRLVHLGDMNIGAAGAPAFDERLITEINLLDPTAVLLTGDLLDATHPDLERGWQALSAFLNRIAAPAIIACGDHDDFARYSARIAPSPVGTVHLGPFRLFVLFDTPARPAAEDPDQMQWVAQRLRQRDGLGPALLLSHRGTPSPLAHWRAAGDGAELLEAAQPAAWFTGGQPAADEPPTDPALRIIRTPRSSPALSGSGDGQSRYTIVDITWRENEGATRVRPVIRMQTAVPAGALEIHPVDAYGNDDTQRSYLIVNRHAFGLDHLQHAAFVGAGTQRPWCQGARLVDVQRTDGGWRCRVDFSVPERGSRRITLGTGPPPRGPQVAARIEAEPRLQLARGPAEDGAGYPAAPRHALVHLTNDGPGTAEVVPLIRLDGETLPYVVLDEPGPMATAYRLRIPARRTVTLQVDFSTVTVAPGHRTLQVYLRGLPDEGPICHPLDVQPGDARRGES